MTTKITVSLTLNTDNPTAQDVANAVRRAAGGLKDTALTLDTPTTEKGVTFKTKAVSLKTPTYSPVREWAAVNGHPEVAGKRGRLSKTVIAEYERAVNK